MSKRIQYVKDPNKPEFSLKSFIVYFLLMALIFALIDFVAGPPIPGF